MILNKQVEEQIKKAVLPLLKQGRSDWDIPHTLDTVSWMKKLIQKEDGNEKILITTMYFHDTGYPVLKKGYNFEELLESKEDHADIAANNAKMVLPKLSFSKTEIVKIVRLVKNHDKYIRQNEYTHDGQLVFEADSLGQINWNVVNPNFDKTNCLKFLNYFQTSRKEIFKTKTGKKYLKKLLNSAIKYLQDK